MSQMQECKKVELEYATRLKKPRLSRMAVFSVVMTFAPMVMVGIYFILELMDDWTGMHYLRGIEHGMYTVAVCSLWLFAVGALGGVLAILEIRGSGGAVRGYGWAIFSIAAPVLFFSSIVIICLMSFYFWGHL